MKISKDMVIMDVINHDRDLAPIFMQYGMHCLGCVMAHGETVEQACGVHGIDCDALVLALNTFLENKDQGNA